LAPLTVFVITLPLIVLFTSSNYHIYITLSKFSFKLFSRKMSVGGVLSHNPYTHIVLSQVNVLGTSAESFDTVLDEVLKRSIIKGFEVLFEVSLGRLAAVTDCHGFVLKVVAGRTSLKDVSTGLIDGSN